MSMGHRIRNCRKINGKTQKELAAILGVKEAAVSKWENDTVENIPRSTIDQMARLFDVNPCYLMDFSDDPSPSEGMKSVYDYVKMELGESAGDLLQQFVSMNKRGQRIAYKAVQAFANMPENKLQKG